MRLNPNFLPISCQVEVVGVFVDVSLAMVFDQIVVAGGAVGYRVWCFLMSFVRPCRTVAKQYHRCGARVSLLRGAMLALRTLLGSIRRKRRKR